MPVEALWDTGAQASIINEEWRKTHLPHRPIRPIEEQVGPGTLIGLAANQTQIPFLGWVEVEFRLPQDQGSSEPLLAPLLVSSDSNVAEQPIIGYNVIQAIISQGDEKQTASQTIQKLSQAFSVTCKMAKLVMQLMREDSECDVGTVYTGKRTIRLAAEKVTTVNVRACAGTQFKGQSLLLVPCDQPNLPEGVTVEEGLVTVTRGKSMCVPVPLMNTNKYDITVNARTVLGYLQTVKTAYTVQSEQLTSTEKQNNDNSIVNQRDVMPNMEVKEKPS